MRHVDLHVQLDRLTSLAKVLCHSMHSPVGNKCLLRLEKGLKMAAPYVGAYWEILWGPPLILDGYVLNDSEPQAKLYRLRDFVLWSRYHSTYTHPKSMAASTKFPRMPLYRALPSWIWLKPASTFVSVLTCPKTLVHRGWTANHNVPSAYWPVASALWFGVRKKSYG